MNKNLVKFSNISLKTMRIFLIIIGIGLCLTLIGIPFGIFCFRYANKLNKEFKYRIKNKTDYVKETYYNEENYNSEEFKSKSELLFEEYKPIIDKHFSLANKINVKYSIAINQSTIFNNFTEECKKLCLEDINIADKYKEYLDKNSEDNKPFYGMYASFSIYAKLCEKQGLSKEAIMICIKSLKLGFTIDGSKGSMRGRLARLIKKYNEENKEQLQYDYENNNLYNENTGEIVK